jgi:hypothetical protein
MISAVYILASLVCLTSAVLLLRGYTAGRHRLLLWSGLCFAGLTISNALVFVDLIILPETDLYPLRLVTAAFSMMVLLFGLVWEGE